MSLHPVCNYLVCGASSGIGLALILEILKNHSPSKVFATHRENSSISDLVELKQNYPKQVELLTLNATCEKHYQTLVSSVSKQVTHLDVIINSVGLLHEKGSCLFPERNLEEFRTDHFQKLIATNTTPTVLLAKHFKDLILKSDHPIFASLSAKIGSLTDNRLGGWYSYRISKAALNMAIKNISIEYGRMNKNALVVALHPGTTASKLSKPFLPGARKKYTVHKPINSAQNLLKVLEKLDPHINNGSFFSWDGKELPW